MNDVIHWTKLFGRAIDFNCSSGYFIFIFHFLCKAHTMANKEQKQEKNDQAEAMDIVEDEEAKQERLVKETISGNKKYINH